MKTSFIKRFFDFFVALFGLLATWWLILIAWIWASIETKSNGFFIQKRIGRDKQVFNVLKIKTMKPVEGVDTSITSADDVRITKSGKFFRKTKIDELPQLWNVLMGEMSFVGPRPDVEGYADELEGKDKELLTIRPGITGPASIKYKNEEEILANQKNPKWYNDNILWKDKVKINKNYIMDWSLIKDIKYIIKTVA